MIGEISKGRVKNFAERDRTKDDEGFSDQRDSSYLLKVRDEAQKRVQTGIPPLLRL